MLNFFKKIIEELEFKTKKVFKSTPFEKTAVFLGTYRGDDVVLKIVDLSNQAKTKSFLKEMEVDQIFKRVAKDLKVTHAIGSGRNAEVAWIIRKYYRGQTLEDFLRDNQSQDVDIIEKIIIEQQKMFKIKDAGFEKYNLRFETNLDKYPHTEKLLGVDLSECRNFYSSAKSEYFNAKNIGTISGDLKPSNVFVTSEGEIILSDFEWLSYDNYSIDLALFWLYLYKYPRQQSFILAKLKSSQEKDFFRASVIRIVISWYNGANAVSGDPLAVEKRALWTKYLLAAGSSFEKLNKTK